LSSGTDAPLDDLCLDIENSMLAAGPLNDWCKYMRLESTEYDLEEEELPVGLATLNYTGFYEEARENTLSSLRNTRSASAITITCQSRYPSRMTVKAVNLDTSEVYYSTQEAVATVNHVIVIPVGSTAHPFFTTYIMTSEAYGLDVPVFGSPPYEDELINIANPEGGG
jgi:hypothetical protein